MKKSCFSLLLILMILISAVFAVNANSAFSGYSFSYFNQKNHIIRIGHKGKELEVKYCYFDGSYTFKRYTLGNNVFDCDVHKGKVYVLYCSSTTLYENHIATLDNGKINDITIFDGNLFNSKSDLVVANDGNYYILSRNGMAQIYNKKGKLINELGPFKSLHSVGGTCYGLEQNSISKLSVNGIVETFDFYSDYKKLHQISDNYFMNTDGKIYSLNDGMENVFSVKLEYNVYCGETDKYIVSHAGDYLYAYDKYTGKLIGKYVTKDINGRIVGSGDYVTVIYPTYDHETFKVDEIFPPKKHKNTTDSNQPKSTNKPTQNNEDNIQPQGQYVLLESGTTSSDLKSQYSDVIFPDNISGQLGTGDNVSINGQAYSIIIKGDVTGEGNINSRDTNAMFDSLLGIELLNEAFTFAGDVNEDGKISNADLVLVANM